MESGYSADSFFAPEASNDVSETSPAPLTPDPLPHRRDAMEPAGRWAGSGSSARHTSNYDGDDEGTHIIGRR